VKVFCDHLYEYKKGLRNLVLHTTGVVHEAKIVEKLEANGIAYQIHALGNETINVFFGNELCIEVLKVMGARDLSALTNEEDFMLGIMLGYDRLQQCARYLKRSRNHGQVEDLIG
jgi:hypothetical protein